MVENDEAWSGLDQQIAWVWIGMQITQLEDLLRVDLVERASHSRGVNSRCEQRIAVGDFDPIHEVRDEKVLRTQFPDYGRDLHVTPMSQCRSQVTTRLCLAAEVDLQGKGRPQMFDYRLQTHGRRQLLECCGDAFQRREIRGDQAVQVGILDLDGDFATIHEPGAVDLCERRGGHRFRLDCAKDLTDRPPELAVDDRLDGRPGGCAGTRSCRLASACAYVAGTRSGR